MQYAHVKPLDEIVHLTLLLSYGLSILTYAVAVAKCTIRQEDELNACWNSVYRKIFGFNKWESVKSFICGLGRLDFHLFVRIRRVKLYFHILHVKHTRLNNMYWIFLSADHSHRRLAVAGVKYRHDLCCDIYEHFRLLCC